jgi:uncharacterized protein (DUF1684 family)
VTRRFPLLLCSLAALACADRSSPSPAIPIDPIDHAMEVVRWSGWRDAMVAGPVGPLAQVALCRIEEGRLPVEVGADPLVGCVVPGPRADRVVGRLVAHRDTLVFEPTGRAFWVGVKALRDAGALALRDQPAVDGASAWIGPLRLTGHWSDGAVTLWVIDTLAEARGTVQPIRRWPVNLDWRFEAEFFPAHDEWRRVETVRGFELPREVAGRLRVTIAGEERELTAYTKGRGAIDLLVVFRDATSGAGSYSAGRFLDVPLPDSLGRTVLDFNRARNPDCAFTEASPCPLPPRENRFGMSIEAGEKAYP